MVRRHTMVHEVGDKVMVDGEECEVVIVYGGGTGYMVETPDGSTKKVVAGRVSEVVEEEEGKTEPEGNEEGGGVLEGREVEGGEVEG